MLRQSNQVLVAVHTALFVLFISTLGVPAFAQGRGVSQTDHNVRGNASPGWGSGDAIGTEGSRGTQGPNRSPGRADDSDWNPDTRTSTFPEAGIIGNDGRRGDDGGNGGRLTLTVVGDTDFSEHYTVLGSTGGLAGMGGQGGLGQAGGHGAWRGDYASLQEHMDGAAGGVGGVGGTGGTGGAGGDLLFTVANGNVIFAARTVFGGTGETGGQGGQGGQGGRGGMGGDAHSGKTTGYGGIGGAAGLGGDGGTGGAGGNVAFTIDNGATTFNGVTFGGSGGNGGTGGLAGSVGSGGNGGDSNPAFDAANNPALNATVDRAGSQGNGGNGGVGGNGALTINGGTTIFQGMTYFGGLGGLNTDGSHAASGNGTLTMNGGILNLDGDMTFRGADSSFMLGQDARLSSGGTTNQIQANQITMNGIVDIANGGSLELAANGVHFNGILSIGLGTLAAPDLFGDMMVSSFSAFNEPAFDTGLNVFGDLTFGSDATVQIYGDDDFFASLYDGWSYNLFSATGEVNGIDYLLANWSASSANEGFNFELRWNAELGLLTVTQAAIPEPATLAIVGLGLAGLGYARRRQMKRKAA